MPREVVAPIDFETRSTHDIKLGLDHYVACDQFRVLVLSGRLPGEEVHHWHRGPTTYGEEVGSHWLERLHAHVRAGGLISAWNAMFEWMVWNLYCVPKLGWPELPLEQVRDSMAVAAAHNLPQSLEKCGEALGLDAEKLKSQRGKYLIGRLCVDHKPTKDREGIWVQDPDLFAELVGYCDQDVVAEESIVRKLRPLTPEQQRVWILTQRINRRGVPVNLVECENILTVVEREKARLNGELNQITQGVVPTATKRDRLLAWVNERVAGPAVELEDPDEDDFEELAGEAPDPVAALENLKGKTVEDALARDDLTPEVRRVLEIRAAVVQTSTAKFSKMLKIASGRHDGFGRLRNLFTYHGAGTGRWASRGGINCFTGDVEVLTPTGWVRFDEWDSQPVMQWWPDGRADFCATPSPVVREHDGSAIEVEAPMFSATMTPEHRIVHWREGKYREKTAEALLSGGTSIPMSAIWTGADVSVFTPDEVRFMVALAADGSVRSRRESEYTVVFGFRKQRKIERMEYLLARLGLKYTRSEYAPQEGHKGGFPTVRFSIPRCPFRKGIGSWVLRLDREGLDALIDELPHWDGCRHQKTGATQFFTSVREEAEWVSLAMHLSGMGATVREYCYDGRKPKFYVYSRLPGSRTTVSRTHVARRQYRGPVYCVSVDSSYIFIRRNGKIAVTGQCQNFARPLLRQDKVVDEIAAAHTVLGAGDHASALLLWGDRTMDAAVSCLRGVLMAPPGHDFIDADYSSVENRVGVWLAGQDDKVEMFRKGLDEYKVFASKSLYNVPYEAVTKDMRQMSKPAVLGCLFGQGWRGLIEYSKGYNVFLTDDRSQEVVKAYRTEYARVRELWYECGDAAIAAVNNPGEWFDAGTKLRLRVYSNFLWMELPSGRRLAWARPKLEEKEAPWLEKQHVATDWLTGEKIFEDRPAMRWAVTVESIDTKTRKYKRHPLIGSSIFQSAVQGTAADILADGVGHTEAAGYETVLLAHDENLALVPEGWGDPDEFGRLMCTPEPWRLDLPLSYEAYRAKRFRK